MWDAILKIIGTILGIFKSKEDRKAKQEEIINQKEYKEAKEKLETVKRKDDQERLVQLANSENAAEAQRALDEIRKRLGK